MTRLAVWADLRVPEVLAGLPAATVRSRGREHVDDVLFDAPDLRLLRSGVQLRRTGDAWHVWIAPSPWWHADCGDDVVLHAEAGDEARPPEVLLGLLRGAIPTAAVTVRVRRRSWEVVVGPSPAPVPTPVAVEAVPVVFAVTADEPTEVVSADAAPPTPPDAPSQPPEAPEPGPGPAVDERRRATVVLEDLTLLTGRRVSARRATVELDGDDELVAQIAARFEAGGAEVVDDDAPVLDLLGGRVRRPVVPDGTGGAGRLPEDATAGQVVSLAIARAVARLLANDLAIRLDLGPEGVHQARVATRRMRSDLKTFAGLIDQVWAPAMRDELKWLAGALGEVRDADVLGERLQDRIAALEPDDQEIAGFLLDGLGAERAAAGHALAEVMAGARYLALLDALVVAANHPPLTADAHVDAAATFDDLARRAWKPLRKAARRAADDPDSVPVERIHAVRIRAKRFRYAADAAAPVEAGAAKHASVLADLQDELGDLNDAANAEAWLRARLAASDPMQAFVLGQLVAAERAEIVDRRRSWLGPWAAVNRRKRRRWLRG